MSHVMRLVFAAMLFTLTLPAAETLPKLQNVKRVVFLGDSITYSGQYIEAIDAYCATRLPERQIEFLNLGLPSETVSGLTEDGHAGGKFPRPELRERLDRVLTKTKPDLIIACYGMNDGIYLPFSEERFQKFTNGIVELRKAVIAAGAKIIHVTPPTFDEVKGGHAGYGAALDRYSEWLLARRDAGWDVADVHGPMNQYLADQRKRDPEFFLAKDGVHCGDTGQWIMAKQILLHLGAKDVAKLDDVAAVVAGHPNGAEILKLVQEKQRFLKDAWLGYVGHKRPGMKRALVLPEAQIKAMELDERLARLKNQK